MAMDPLVDGHGRAIGDVRISVTDRCNFRCQYCMPAEGLPWLERDDILTFEEIARLVALLAAMGVHDVRLTGGEPLVRRELPAAGRRCSPRLDGVHDLSLTTNGYLLEREAEALVRAGVNALQRLARLAAARPLLPADPPRRARRRCCAASRRWRRFPEAHPIKVNVVALRGLHRGRGRCRFAEFARKHPYEVRFIEFMPLDADHTWTPDRVLHRRGDPRARSTRVYPLEAVAARAARAPRASSASPTAQGAIGFITPVSEPFCGDCNRIRLTAEGKLRTCLFSLNETDLRDAAARRAPTDDELEQIIRDAVWRKELKHHVNERASSSRADDVAIGG